MDVNSTIVRDFIYIDVERLYSFYSQVFGGVAEQIIKSVGKGHERTDAQLSSPRQGKSYEEQVTDLSQRTETAILHDYLYKRLEERLGEAIKELGQLSLTNYQSTLSTL